MAQDDFGIPCPGEVLRAERWAKTGIDRLPLDGPFDWSQLFGRSAPVVLDLGCGNGRSTICLALNRSEYNYLGCDVLPVALRHAIRRANQRGLHQVRFAVADAKELLARLVAPASVSEIHLYHPQPYYDVAQVHRRLVTAEFLLLVARALRPCGQFIVQTDNPGYWRYLQATLPVLFELREQPGPWPFAPHGVSRREILARGKNFPIYRGVGALRANLDLAAARLDLEAKPPPVFDADRRLRELDRWE